jgi:cytochrome c peroxidase
MWDGRRDSAFSQVFSPIQSSLEFNSSPLFVAQQIYRLYRAGYEALFGPMPPLLTDYLVLSPSQAGCATFPADPVHDVCSTADDTVKRVVVNFGKAIEAYTRKLACGRSRFDQWMDGDTSALSSTEQAGAALFVGKASCVDCHSGPYLTDRSFHNLGIPGELVPFTGVFTANDPGAAPALAALLVDPLNTKGVFSDGYDGRLDTIPSNLSSLTGSFHTPSLRCVTRRVAFMHNGQFRSLQDAVAFLSQGPADAGYLGVAVNFASNLSVTEQAQLVAFLGALDGTGPDPALETAPALP